MVKSILLFNLYLPCYENSAEYRAKIAFYVGFIENILNTVPFSDVIILGDTNFDINDAKADYSLLKPLLLNYNIVHCDDLINGPTNVRTIIPHSVSPLALIISLSHRMYVLVCLMF